MGFKRAAWLFPHRRGIQPSPALVPCLFGKVWSVQNVPRDQSAAGGHKHCYTYSSHLDRSTCGWLQGEDEPNWLSCWCVTVCALAWRPPWEKNVAL